MQILLDVILPVFVVIGLGYFMARRGSFSESAVDTLMIARRKYPGSPASLDALCRKFSINLDDRKAKGHGAMLDVELLAQVYLELLGGRQQGLELLTQPNAPAAGAAARTALPARPSPLAPRLREQELKVHAAMVVGLGKDSIWRS